MQQGVLWVEQVLWVQQGVLWVERVLWVEQVLWMLVWVGCPSLCCSCRMCSVCG